MGDSKPGREELQKCPKIIEESEAVVASPGPKSPDQQVFEVNATFPVIESPMEQGTNDASSTSEVMDHEDVHETPVTPTLEGEQIISNSVDFQERSPQSIPPTSPVVESSSVSPQQDSVDEGPIPTLNGKGGRESGEGSLTSKTKILSGSPLNDAVEISDDDGELSDIGRNDRSKSPADKRSALEQLKSLKFSTVAKKLVFASELKNDRQDADVASESDEKELRKRDRLETSSSPPRRVAALHPPRDRVSRSKTPETDRSHRKRRYEDDIESKREKKREPKLVVQPNTVKQRADGLINEETKVSQCDEAELRKMVARAYEMLYEQDYILKGRNKLIDEMRKIKSDEENKIQKAIDAQPDHLKKVAIEKYQEIKGIPSFLPPPFSGMPPIIGMPPFGMPPFGSIPPSGHLPMTGAPPFAPPIGIPPPFPPPHFGGPPPNIATSQSQSETLQSISSDHFSETVQESSTVTTSTANFSNPPPNFTQPPPPVNEPVTTSTSNKLPNFSLPPPIQTQQAPYAIQPPQKSSSSTSMPNLSLPPPNFSQPPNFNQPPPGVQQTSTTSQPSAPYKAAVPLGFGGGGPAGMVNGSAPTGTPPVAANQLNSILTKMISNMAQRPGMSGTGMMGAPIHRAPPPHLRNMGGRGSPYNRDTERKGGRGGRALKTSKDDSAPNTPNQTTMEA